MLDLMGITPDYQRARSKTQFLELLSSVSEDVSVVHIATHGGYEHKKGKPRKFRALWTPDKENVTIRDIKAAGIDLSGKTVVSTACYSGQKTAGEAFKRATGCKHYIAPIKGPRFYNAAFMCHIFYHKHIALKRNVKTAFSQYENRYKNPHVFRLL